MSDKSHILVIDDEKNYLLVLQTLLEDEGYTVTAISDPETALAFLAESEVDVVVTDMKMPKVSGREVLQHVKKSWPYIPVLIMTAFGSIESAVEAMKYGAFDYITKPFSPSEMVARVKAHLARYERLIGSSMPDNEIIGGYMDLYLLAEREGTTLEQSREVKFIEDQTAFKATARYDGKPVRGEAFVVVRYDNVAPVTSATFAADSAN